MESDLVRDLLTTYGVLPYLLAVGIGIGVPFMAQMLAGWLARLPAWQAVERRWNANTNDPGTTIGMALGLIAGLTGLLGLAWLLERLRLSAVYLIVMMLSASSTLLWRAALRAVRAHRHSRVFGAGLALVNLAAWAWVAPLGWWWLLPVADGLHALGAVGGGIGVVLLGWSIVRGIWRVYGTRIRAVLRAR